MPRPNKEKQEEQIMITTLKAQKRDTAVKAKKLRRDGFTTGVLYGREMEESMPLQFDTKDAVYRQEYKGRAGRSGSGR